MGVNTLAIWYIQLAIAIFLVIFNFKISRKKNSYRYVLYIFIWACYGSITTYQIVHWGN